ncbi:hypothetical protein ACFRNH_38755, partial [Streptomyces sp. NPDC056785]
AVALPAAAFLAVDFRAVGFFAAVFPGAFSVPAFFVAVFLVAVFWAAECGGYFRYGRGHKIRGFLIQPSPCYNRSTPLSGVDHAAAAAPFFHLPVPRQRRHMEEL